MKKLISATLLLFALSSSTIRAQSIDFSYDYENALPPNEVRAGGGSYTSRTSPTLPNSNRSMEHFISNNDERAEIIGVDNGVYGSGDDVWYVVSYYFPTGWHTSTPGEPTYTILNQLVPYNGASSDQQACRAVFTCNRVKDGCSKGAPASDLTIDPSGSTFTYRTNYFARTTGGKNYFDCEEVSFPAGLDQWHTIVFHLKIGSQAGQGLLEVWHNGDLKYSKQRDVVLPGRTIGQWKYGAYVGDPNHGTRRVFTDGFYAGNNYASLNAFLSDTPYGGTTSLDPVPVTGVTIADCPNAPLAVGNQVALSASVRPAGASNPSVTWASSNPQIASVDDQGRVTALSSGSTTIQVTTTEGSFSDQCALTVSESSDCRRTNLALGGSIHSVSSEQSGNPATNLIDGIADDDDNRWSAFEMPQWVIIDLGSEQPVGGVVLTSYQQRAYQYEVYASTDLSAVESKTTSALVGQGVANVSLSVAVRSARYVRLEVTGARNYEGNWVSVREWEVLSGCADSLPSSIGEVGVEKGVARTGPALPEVQVYPNPTEDQLTVVGGQDYRVVVYDLVGRPVMRHNALRGRVQLDVAHLLPGVYLLHAWQGGQGSQRRVIIR